MLEQELLEYYKKMCERNIVLDFQGAISQDMLVGMAELIKNKFSQVPGNRGTAKKIFSIFITKGLKEFMIFEPLNST